MKGTLVLIHGMWSAPEHWANARRFFEARGWSVVAPALRHHDVPPGATPPPGLGTTGLLDYVADLEAQIRALGGRPILIGHSMGGLLAQVLAARLPCAALVLLAPAAPRGIVAISPSVLWSFRTLLLRCCFWRRPHRPTRAEADFGILNGFEPGERDRLRATLRHESGRATAQTGLWWFDTSRASAVDARLVRCPVLVVVGTEDRLTPPSSVRRVARRYGARLLELPGRAHWLPSEPGWEELCERVERWLVTVA